MFDFNALNSARNEYEDAFCELQALFTAVAVMQSTVSSEKDDDSSDDTWTGNDELVYRTVNTLKTIIAEHIKKAAASEQKYSRLLSNGTHLDNSD